MNLVYNEQVKLLAVTFNNLGIATIVTGAVAPISSYVYGVYQSVPLPTIMADERLDNVGHVVDHLGTNYLAGT